MNVICISYLLICDTRSQIEHNCTYYQRGHNDSVSLSTNSRLLNNQYKLMKYAYLCVVILSAHALAIHKTAITQ